MLPDIRPVCARLMNFHLRFYPSIASLISVNTGEELVEGCGRTKGRPEFRFKALFTCPYMVAKNVTKHKSKDIDLKQSSINELCSFTANEL